MRFGKLFLYSPYPNLIGDEEECWKWLKQFYLNTILKVPYK